MEELKTQGNKARGVRKRWGEKFGEEFGERFGENVSDNFCQPLIRLLAVF